MENIFWDIEFDGTSKNDGVLWVSITFGTDVTPPGTRGTVTAVSIRANMSPDDKAQATINALRAAFGTNFFEIEFDAPDDDFKLKVRNPGPNERYIHDMSVRDFRTGEDIDAVKDDPGKEELLMIAFFSVEGKGKVEDGVARLQIGKEYPLVNVKTFGRTGTEIILELMHEFNQIYAKLGFAACELPGVPGIGIEKVPCPLGIRAGTTDTGLVTERGLLRPSVLE